MLTMRTSLTILSVMLVLVLTGCVNYDERIELNEDGSGVVRMHIAISEQVIPARFRGRVTTEEALFPAPRKELIADIEKDGLKVRSLRAESTKGLRHYYLVIEFKKLDDLARSDLLGGRRIAFRKDGAKFVFDQVIDLSTESLTDRMPGSKKSGKEKTETKDDKGRKKSDSEKPDDKKQPEKKEEDIITQLEKTYGSARVRKMFRAYHVSFSAQLANGTLITSNGENHIDKAAIWQTPLDKLLHNRMKVEMKATFVPKGQDAAKAPGGQK